MERGCVSIVAAIPGVMAHVKSVHRVMHTVLRKIMGWCMETPVVVAVW